MKILARLRSDRRARQRAEMLALLLLAAAAVYLWTAPIRAERALRNASFSELVAASKRDPNNPHVFYYLGMRLRNFGQNAPAKAAFARAASLDGDYEDAWLAWASTAGTLGSDQETFAVLQQYVKTHPGSARAHFALALFYHEEDALQRAYEEALATTRIHPTDWAAWRLAGLDAIELQRYGDAETALRQAIAHNPKDWRSQLGLGSTLHILHRDREALPCYQQAAALAPEQAEPITALGRAMLAIAVHPDDREAARQALLRAARLNPNYWPAQLALGQSYLKEHRWQEARQVLENAERLQPSEPSTYFELARACQGLGLTALVEQQTRLHKQTLDYQMEKVNLQSRLYQVKDDLPLRLRLARICAAHGDYAEAARWYRRLIARAPKLKVAQQELDALERNQPQVAHHAVTLPLPQSASAQAMPAASLLRDADAMLAQKRYEEAAFAYHSVLAKDPKSALAYQGLGLALDGQGKEETAFSMLNRAVRLNPNLAVAEFTLARLYDQAGFADESVRRMEVAVRQEPNNARYLHALGVYYNANQSRYFQAEQALERAAALQPGNAGYRRDLAVVEAKMHDDEAAEKDYRQALQLAPKDPAILADLGAFLLDNHPTLARRQEAERLFKTCVGQDANNLQALVGLGRVSLLQGDAQHAVAYLERAILIRPATAPAWYQLARAYDRLGDQARADNARTAFRDISDYETDLFNTVTKTRNDLKDAPLRLKLARLYARGGQNARAINQYQVCLALDPKNETARKELTMLVQQLQAHGQMPSMVDFNALVRSSIRR